MNPSLLLIPDRYKAAKLYSQIPDSGAGDLTFARNSNATRVNSAGLIEKVRTNLYPRGSALLSTGWTSVGATLTAGQTDPNGGTTALRVQLAAAQVPYAYILQTFTGSAATYTRSAFIKGATAQSIRIVDPFTGVGTTINLTTSYQRFASVGAGIPPSFGIQFDNDNDDLAKDFTIAFVQIEEGDIATPYIPTTTAAVSVGITADIPRLDYTGGGCPSLLLEPQRTNTLTFSENFNNAGWTKTNSSITANNAVSPDGYQNADKFIPNSASQGILQQNHAITAAQTNTLSVFAKDGGLNDNFVLNSRDNASASNTATIAFNLSTGAIATAATATGSYSAASGTITPYGNGWYRLTLTHTSSISTTTRFRYFNEAGSGDGTNGYLVYGAQAELNASYATSYIPTLGASVTRLADAAFKTGISSLIGQTAGTLYVEADLTHSAANNEYLIQVRGNNSNRFFIYREGATNKLGCFALVGASTIYTTLTASAATGTIKAAFAYESGSFAFYVNGVQVGTSSATYTISTALTEFFIDQNNGLENGFYSYNGAGLYTTRLSNSELASLTSL
jgi:hypothetical protein